ncbi:MAG: hypothetical protein JSR46_00575 [Verrucomicrobia bacterium]|nr:hypothetical protein [Verrucomicrobiota bacterium]
MLEFDPLANELSIRVKTNPLALQRPLIKALIWSAVFHLCLVSAFRIKMIDFHEVKYPITPIDVAIDDEEGPKTSVALQQRQHMQPIMPISDPCWDACRHDSLKEPLPLPCPLRRPLPGSLGSVVPDSVIASSEKSLSTRPRLYPLKLKFSPTLKKLKVLVDGSSLFKQQEDPMELHLLFLAPAFFSIKYDVRIDGKSGKVVRWNREKKLGSTYVQTCADMIVSHLRFAPSTQEQIGGRLSLSFRCTEEKLKELLIDPEVFE